MKNIVFALALAVFLIASYMPQNCLAEEIETFNIYTERNARDNHYIS